MKKRKYMAAGLLLGALLLALPGRALADEGSGETAAPVTMEISRIYGNTARLGQYVPLHVKLYGQSGNTFSGSVAVETLENGNDGEGEVYRYQYPVEVTTAETKKLEINVPLGARSSGMIVRLLDDKGKELDLQRLSFDVSRERGRLLAGVLSEQPEELSYLDKVNLDYGMVQSQVLFLEGETFPESERGLEILDILIINDFDTESLGEEKKEAIENWVEAGGTLLFGTGVSARETLGDLGLSFLELPIGIPRYESVSLGNQYAGETPEDSSVSMYCVELTVPGGREILESGGHPIFSVKEEGDGQVGFFSFDLGDLKEFAEKNPAYPIQFFMEVMGDQAIAELAFSSMSGHSADYWSAQSLVNSGNAERLPNLTLYTAVIGGYILLIGPGLYLFLKKKDLSRYYGKAVSACALVCGGVIYLLGMETRFTSEFYTYATVLSVDGTSQQETSFLNIRTPDSRPFSVDIGGGYEMTALADSAQWYGDGKDEAMDENQRWNMGLSFGEESVNLSAKRSRAFEPRLFKAEKSGEAAEGGISSQLVFEDGKLSGTITSQYPFPLENAAILAYGQVLILEGTLEPGETRTFENMELLTWPVGLPYLLAGKVTEGSENTSDEAYLDRIGIESLYSYYLDSQKGEYKEDLVLTAFGAEQGLSDSLKAVNAKANGKTLYATTLLAERGQGESLSRSGQLQKPKVTSGSGTVYGEGLVLYGSDPLTVEYYLGADLEVEKLSFFPVSPQFFDDPSNSRIRPFDGTAAFFNLETRTYDPVDLTRRDFMKAELRPYLTEDNSLVVQYMGNKERPEYSLVLPHLMVTGRER